MKGSPWVLLYCDVEWADVQDMPAATYEECEAKRKAAREGKELVQVVRDGENVWHQETGFDMK